MVSGTGSRSLRPVPPLGNKMGTEKKYLRRMELSGHTYVDLS